MSPGYVRVTNKRYGIGPKPDAEETDIPVDRTNWILGNRVYLRNPNDIHERRKVIRLYRSLLDDDVARKGPMYSEIKKIADRVLAGEKVCLSCWCAPRECHADVIAERVMEMVGNGAVGISASSADGLLT